MATNIPGTVPVDAIAALQAVEDWWLTQADQSNGAPACIFMVRQALAEHRRMVVQLQEQRAKPKDHK